MINNKIEYIGDNEESGNFNLSLIDSVPDGFVLKSSKDKYEMLFPCCILGNIKVEPFAVSKYEVSNSEYKEFIENGGYEYENFWDFPITIGDRLYTYKNSIKKFIGKFMRILIAILYFTPLCLFSQKMFSVKYQSQADIKVFVTRYSSQADLNVFKVKYQSQAIKNEGKWFFVKYQSQADKKIYFVDYVSQSDLKIFFTKYSSQSGWRNKEKVHLLY